MKRDKLKDGKLIMINPATKKRLDEMNADLMLGCTYNELILWLLDMRDNINRKTPIQPLHTPEEWAQEYKKWRDSLTDEDLDDDYQNYLNRKNDK